MSKQGCTALLAKPHFRSERKHFGTSLNRTHLCHTGTMQASILKSKLKQMTLGEDAKTSSLLESVPIALIHWLVQEALSGHSSPNSTQSFPTQTPRVLTRKKKIAKLMNPRIMHIENLKAATSFLRLVP